MAAPWLNAASRFFLLAANFICNPVVKVSPNGHSNQAQNTSHGTRKYS